MSKYVVLFARNPIDVIEAEDEEEADEIAHDQLSIRRLQGLYAGKVIFDDITDDEMQDYSDFLDENLTVRLKS